jgi:hypothetical protein
MSYKNPYEYNPYSAENSQWNNQQANKWSAENAAQNWNKYLPDNEDKESKNKKTTFFRLIFYGGARLKSHNSAFEFAAKNVKKDYSDGKIKLIYVKSGKEIIEKINSYETEQIQSIDFITHGSPLAIFIIKGSSLTSDISSEEVEEKKLNASLYASKTAKLTSTDNSDLVDVINRIDYSKFTNQAKIEFHGCQTAMNVIVIDSLVENFSEYLYDKSKKEAVVIGHTEKANPNINGEGTTDLKDQDYRHGNRIVVQNGEIIYSTNQKGRIKFSDYKDKLL